MPYLLPIQVSINQGDVLGGSMKNELCSGYGQHHSPNASHNPKPLAGVTWEEILELVDNPQKVGKSEAQWLIPSTLKSRAAIDQKAHGEYWLLWADIDENPPVLEILKDVISSIVFGCDFEAYTSYSATNNNQKARVLIPLSEAINPQLWVVCQQALNNALEERGITPDRVNERPSQLCYLPNDGGYYRHSSIRNRSNFKPAEAFSAELERLEEIREATIKTKELQQAIAEQKRLNRTKEGTESPIDWYNSNTSISSILIEHGYVQHDNQSFTSPWSQSGSKSTNIDPSTGRLHALSSSDPLYNNGEGAHDAYSVYTVLTHNSDDKAAWKAVSDMMKQAQDVAVVSPLDKLLAYSITNITDELRAQMFDDVYVFKGLAIRGHWTVFYASPNTGKTLLSLWLLREQLQGNEINPATVFYINADDAFKGSVEKAELAKQLGCQMLVPGIKGFRTQEALPLMEGLVQLKQANQAIIILDTLKKFTDLMDKRTSSDFGKIARLFVAAGGTLICLAHTNKNKDHEGQSIFSGTSDIVDDADCAYIIEGGEATGGKLAEFHNIKCRGDVEREVCFRFDREAASYERLLDSVERIENSKEDAFVSEAILNKELADDRELIDSALGFMPEEGIAKTSLVKLITDDTGVSRRQVIKTLDKWDGDEYFKGHRWKSRSGEKNAKIFEPIKCPFFGKQGGH